MNECKIGMLLSYLNVSVHIVIEFLYIPILLHYIGKSEYGGVPADWFAYCVFGHHGLRINGSHYPILYEIPGAAGSEEHGKSAGCIFVTVWGAAFGLAVDSVRYLFSDIIFGGSMTTVELVPAKQLFLLLLLMRRLLCCHAISCGYQCK